MRHTREEVIRRTTEEYERLDGLVANLSEAEWDALVPRPETKDAWTVKDVVAHITHWKADVIRKAMRLPVAKEEKGLNWTDGNRLVYERWRNKSAQEVLAWHRRVHKDALKMLKEMPEAWFSGREHRADWPNDLDGHCAYHREKDIANALKKT